MPTLIGVSPPDPESDDSAAEPTSPSSSSPPHAAAVIPSTSSRPSPSRTPVLMVSPSWLMVDWLPAEARPPALGLDRCEDVGPQVSEGGQLLGGDLVAGPGQVDGDRLLDLGRSGGEH